MIYRMLDDTAEPIDRWRKDVLNPYCKDSCQDKCCRLDRLFLSGLTKEQIELMFGNDQSLIESSKKQGHLKERFTIRGKRFELRSPICPSYDQQEGLCRVYDEPLKPDQCRKFPLQILPDENKIEFTMAVSPMCELMQKDFDSVKRFMSGVKYIRDVIYM